MVGMGGAPSTSGPKGAGGGASGGVDGPGRCSPSTPLVGGAGFGTPAAGPLGTEPRGGTSTAGAVPAGAAGMPGMSSASPGEGAGAPPEGSDTPPEGSGPLTLGGGWVGGAADPP